MNRALELGKAIKAFRLERDMTQEEMAGYLGISRVTVNRLEAGRTKVTYLLYAKVRRKLEKMSAQLEVA